jgi:hypothetical protein
MIENGLPATFDDSKREGYFQSYLAELNLFGYFGHLNPYKGCAGAAAGGGNCCRTRGGRTSS